MSVINGRPSHSTDDTPDLTHLHELLADAFTIAKKVKLSDIDGPAIRKAYKLTSLILQALRPIDSTAKSIRYDSLEKGLKALQKDCKRDWSSGSDIQSDMMRRMSMEIIQWISTDLWWLMCQGDVDMELIRISLNLCSSTIRDIQSCNSRLVDLLGL